MRPAGILAQHQPRPLDGGLACTCHNWQTCLMPGAADHSAWGFAEHQIEMLNDAGWDITRRPANPKPGPWATWGGDGVGP